MKKNSASIGNSGAYTSPGTPEYVDNYAGGIQKGWMSERVPLSNSSRRHIGAAALMPFNSGRALPSKWDDAERWITSPVSGYASCKTSSLQPHRRPKSKSGPLGAPGLMYLPNYSPAVPVLEGGSGRNFMAGSPFNTGVLVPDGLSIHYSMGNGAKSTSSFVENTLVQSTTLPGLTDMLNEPSIPTIQGNHSLNEPNDKAKDAESPMSRVVSRRDMATQMSPEGSTHSSLNGRSSFSTFCASMPIAAEPQSYNSAIVEVRDVQVDNDATITRPSRKHLSRKIKKGSSDVKVLASPWDVASTAKNALKLQREEAKITAWENLQKAKAEAAIRKLEMKLEKKRSASMDKILNKLRAAEMKAQEMRNSVTDSQAHRSPRASHKIFLFKHVKMGSLSNCFFCCK